MFGANEILINYQNSLEGPIIDFPLLKKLIIENKPKLFCLPNPDSPTGTIFDKANIITLLDFCLKNEIINDIKIHINNLLHKLF
jgi:histidinol-phosphate aminotransferase